MPSTPYQGLRADWLTILRRHMDQQRYNDRALAKAAGLSPTVVNEWFRKGKQPSSASLARVAAVLKMDLNAFKEGEHAPGEEDPAPKELAPATLNYVRVAGTLQAGFWQEPDLQHAEDAVVIPAIPHPEYGDVPQSAWKVVGQSMNRLAPPGSYVIGVSFYDIDRPPQHRDVVICERRRGGTYEYTLKRAHVSRAGIRLDPESDDPQFQEPVWVNDGKDEEADEVRATHLIIGGFRFF